MHVIPQSWAHLHILVGVFPSFGLLFVLGFYATAFLTNDTSMKRTCLILFALLAILSIPTYLSGDNSMAVLSGNPRIPRDLLNAHSRWGIAALIVLVITGAAALAALRQSGRAGRASNIAFVLVSGLCRCRARTDHRGGRLGDQSPRAAVDHRHSRRDDPPGLAACPYDLEPFPHRRNRIRDRIFRHCARCKQ